MITMLEIQTSALKLPASDRQRLLLLLAESLRQEGQKLPPPRRFSLEEMQGWIEEDDASMKRLREDGLLDNP